MKFKPKLLQLGGSMLAFTPVNWQTIDIGGSGGNSEGEVGASNQEGGTPELLSKEAIKQLYENGLQNDVEAYVKKLQGTLKILMQNPKAAPQIYLSQVADINKIITNKKMLEDAVKMASNNKGMNSWAITSTGSVIVRDKEGKIHQMSPKELAGNTDLYMPLTNQELLKLRQTDPNFAFNSSIPEVIGNAIGQEAVADQIQKITKALESDTVSKDTFIKFDKSAMKGLEYLTNPRETAAGIASGPEGVYKSTEEVSSTQRQEDAALRAMFETLDPNMQTWLEVQSVVRGTNPYQIVRDFITKESKLKSSTKLDFDAAATKAMMGDDGSGKSTKTSEESQATAMMMGHGTPINHTIQLGKDAQFTFNNVMTWQYPISKDDKAVDSNISVQDLFTNTKVGHIFDHASVYFGQTHIGSGEFDKLAYYRGDPLMALYLPYTTKDGYHKIPDFGALSKIAESKKEIESRGNITEQEKRDIYKKHDVEKFYTLMEVHAGKVRTPEEENLVAPFMTFTAFSTDDRKWGINDLKNQKDPWIIKNPSSNEGAGLNKDEITQILNQVFSNDASQRASGNKRIEVDITNGINWITGSGDNVYSGRVFVPIQKDMISELALEKQLNIPESYTNVYNMLTGISQSAKRSGLSYTTLPN